MDALPVRNEEDMDSETISGLKGEVSAETVESTAEPGESGYESNLQSSVGFRSVIDRRSIQDVIMVNNMVVDNELGGREVTVLPSWKKVWSGVERGRFTPSKWLQTDRVILSMVRWGGAYLCAMSDGWSVDPFGTDSGKQCGEILEKFFSEEGMRRILQHVEWGVDVENGGREYFGIHRFGDEDIVELTDEMITPYGTRDTSYSVIDKSTVDAYSFEFSSLVGSHPASNKRYSTANRENCGGTRTFDFTREAFGEAVRRHYIRY